MDAIDAIEFLQEMCSNNLVVEGLTDSPWDDFFLGLSEGNRTVVTVRLPLSKQGESFSSWEKVGKAIGNLEALQEIELVLDERPMIDLMAVERSIHIPAWYTLSYVLSFLRRKIKLRIGYYRSWNEDEVQHFATAIRHNPFIKAVEQRGGIPITCFYIFVNGLATLPALEDVILRGFAHRDPLKAATMVSMQLQVLLQSRSLKSLTFDGCWITREIVECLTLALNGSGSTLTCLRFDQCEFLYRYQGPGLIDIANALRTSTSLTRFEYDAVPESTEYAFAEEMQQVLRVNTTLTDLKLRLLDFDDPGYAIPQIITALGDNTTLKKCRFHIDSFEDPDLSEAMRTSLERNSTLESLHLQCLTDRDDDDDDDDGALTVSFTRLRETVPFLRINASLKSLTLFCENAAARDVGRLCIETLSALAVNASLEYLDIETSSYESIERISSVDYLTAIAALGPNTTLKTLHLHPNLDLFDKDQVEELLSLIRKNYGLEKLDDGLPDPTGELGYILRMNKAGRHYILRDPSSIPDSIGVFAGVSDDVNCVLVHMLENPRLCDQRTVEMVSAVESSGSSTNPTAGVDGVKRERASVCEGKVSQKKNSRDFDSTGPK